MIEDGGFIGAHGYGSELEARFRFEPMGWKFPTRKSQYG
jgi:hypothetical protein